MNWFRRNKFVRVCLCSVCLAVAIRLLANHYIKNVWMKEPVPDPTPSIGCVSIAAAAKRDRVLEVLSDKGITCWYKLRIGRLRLVYDIEVADEYGAAYAPELLKHNRIRLDPCGF